MIASALLVLAAANVARAQVSTASLFPVGFQDDGLQGEVVGTGAQGTTFVLSATFEELGVPYTMTLVQDATHVSIGAGLETAGVTVPVDVQCAMGGGEAVCREVVGSGIDATTFTESGAVFLTGVPVEGGGSGGGSAVTSPTTRTTPSATFITPSTSGSVLPPTISVGSRTATLSSGDDTLTTGLSLPGGSDSGSASGAMKSGIIALGLALPAALAVLNTF